MAMEMGGEYTPTERKEVTGSVDVNLSWGDHADDEHNDAETA